MGGFHQLRVRQKTIYKRYACLELKKWFVDAEVIAEGPSAAAIEGRHYYRNMGLLKESFNSLIQFRTKDALESMQELCDALRQLNECPSREREGNVLQSNQFKLIYERNFDTQGT